MNIPISSKEVPFLKLLIPLVAGILCQHQLNLFSNVFISYLFILGALSFVLLSYFISNRWSFRWYFGVAVSIFLFISGASLTINEQPGIKPNERTRVLVKLLEKPHQRGKSFRVVSEVSSIYINHSWYPEKAKVLLYFNPSDSMVEKLSYGSIIATQLNPVQVSSPSNPKQFDFKKYLSHKGISYTSSVLPNSWILIDNQGNVVKEKAIILSEKLIELFKTSGLKSDELAVASALTIGYKELLDDELRKVYSSSGTMHILAVSGMHVAILYYLLSFMLVFLNKRKSLRIVKAIILILFLWFFAIITGLSPSVQRAALMLSFIVIGDSLDRKIPVYNSLAASAFLLLVINPYSFFDTGFQLSYIAVLSIVFFYPLINQLFRSKYKVLDYAWSIIAVSIAAQIGTFSLSLFYFNQFPNYFLLSNLIAIPLSTIAIYLAVALIIFSPIGLVTSIIGKLFSLSLFTLNNSLRFIEDLPFSVSSGIYIDNLQLLIILLTIVTFAIFIINRNKYLLFILFSLIISLQVTGIWRSHKTLQRNELVVYSIPKQTLLSFKEADKLTFISGDSSSIDIISKYGFFVKGYLNSIGITKNFETFFPKTLGQQKSSNNYLRNDIYFRSFKGYKVAYIYGDKLENYKTKFPLGIDILIVDNNFPKNLLQLFNPKRIVISSSMSYRKVENLKIQCLQRGITLHNVATQGAFIF